MRIRTGLASAIGVLLSFGGVLTSHAQTRTPDGAWTLLKDHSAQVTAEGEWIRPSRGQALEGEVARLRQILWTAPLEFTPEGTAHPLILELPDPEGNVQKFAVVESPIMEPALAAEYPDIKTFVGQGISDPYATLRADVTMLGFHAQVLSPGGAWYIDPFSRDDTKNYTSYYRRDLKNVHPWACEFAEDSPAPVDLATTRTSGTTLRTYRLACAATGEYTAFFGGTVAAGQASIVTAVNRVTGVYETELTIRLTLVANNSNLVYTNSGTDPYTNGSGSTMLTQNQTTCDSIIGTANYDIGHVFSTGGGGIAGLGVVCNASRKAQGVTGSTSPTGDAYWIDYVAHEMGHQFGANHNFQSATGSCGGGNRNASTADEPGSGSLIMAYAGICGTDDLQPHSDPYFNFISHQEIIAYVTASGTCSVNTATGNTIPTVTATGGYTIPKGTPFFLTASGSDGNGDPITYYWEDRNFGGATATALTTADNGVMPLFRCWSPVTTGTRYFPMLSTVVAGTTSNVEKVPQVARAAFNFRCTVRDNRANGGGVGSTDVSLVVNGTAGPFTVTSPASATSWAAGSTQTVTWNVASTNVAPVNCANVSILLSTDGGVTFPITVEASTGNTGSATFTVPNNQTTTGRIMVRSVGNVFYNVGAGVVTITPPINGVVLSGTGANTFTDTTGNGNANTRIDPGETDIRLTVPVSNTGNVNATGVSATLVSNTPTVTVTTATSAYPNLNASGGTGSNATPYVLNVSASHTCGSPISLTLNITSAQGNGTYNFSLPTGLAGGTGGPTTFSYTGPAVAIPDNSTTGATANLAVSGLTGTISDVNFRFDGSSCSNAAGSTTVGLDHTYVGDLTITLQSPTGTIVTLVSRPTNGAGSASGNNFCNTVLDDSGASSIQSIGTTGDPYTGTWSPSSPLSALNGQNPNGTWILKAVDGASVDTGNIRAFSLIITSTLPPSCDPPSSGCTGAGIAGNPSNQTVCSGSPASFSVTASGTAPFTYQWRKNTSNIGGATSATYTIASAVIGDAGSYDCVVTNSCGNATSTAATLTVNTGAGIAGNPSNQTVCSGSPASFTVSASGTPAPTYQWRKNTVNIGGATSATYNIPATTTGSAGSYDCVVTNACGSATSTAATLTVNTAAGVASNPSNQTVCAGSPASFSVTANGTAPFTYQWRKNTANIGGATSATFNIAAATTGDAGSYDCVVTNACGNATSTAAVLTINSGPSITTQPSNASVANGSSASFSVVASGTAPLSYQWRKDLANLTDGGPISGSTTASLSINPVAGADAGSYDCVITNPCGTTTSDAATLTVGPCPSDLDDGSGTGTPDGGVDINDLLYFLAAYEAGDLAADLDDGTGTGTPDGGVDINDLLFFLSHYEAGC